MTKKGKPPKASIPVQDQAKQYLDLAATLMVALDPEGRISCINKKGCEILGYEHSELIGKDWFATSLPERVRAQVKSVFSQIMHGESQPVEYFENPLLTKMGEERTFAFHNAILRDSSGQIIGTFSSGEDITERKRSEIALQESEEKYRSLVERAGEGIVIIQDGIVRYVNPSLAGMRDQTVEELVGTLFETYIHPDDRPKLKEWYRRRVQGESLPSSYDAVLLRRDGSKVYVGLTAEIISYQGKPADLVIIHDITERKSAEAALQEAETRYQTLVEQIPAIVYTENGEDLSQCIYISPQLEAILGYTPEEWIADPRLCINVIHPDDRQAIDDEDHRTNETGEPFKVEYRAITRDGRIVWIHDESFLRRNAAGRSLFWQGIMIDITERKQSEIAQQAIYEISRAVISTKTLDGLYQAIHLALKNVLPVENFYIALYNPVENLLSFPYFVDQYDDPPSPQLPDRGLTEYVLRTGEPLLAGPAKFAELLKKGEVEQVGTDSLDWLGVPLILGKEVIGVMVVQTYTRNIRFDQRDLDIMSFVSIQVAMAIERKKAEEALAKSEEHFRTLVEMSPEPIVVHCEGKIVFVNPAGLKMIGAKNAEELLGKGVLGLVHPSFREFVKSRMEQGIQQRVMLPVTQEKYIRLDGRVIDVEVAAIPITYQDKPAMQVILRDITERKAAEEVASQRARELKALYDTSLDIISNHDLPLLLETIVVRAAGLLNASSGGLYLCDPEQRTVRCMVSYNTLFNYTGTVLQYGEGAAGTVAETGMPLILDDYRTWTGRSLVFEKDKPFTTMLSVPMKWQEEVRGVLHVLDELENRRFTDADLALLNQFANLAAIAVENARLYQQVQNHANELENRVTERTVELRGRVAQVEELNLAMANLLNDLQEANRRLEETSNKLKNANSELETFAYSVSHDLKAPLRGIDGYSNLLLDQYASQLDEEGRFFLQNIHRASIHMGQLIDDLLTYSRLERRVLAPGRINPNTLFEALLSEYTEEIHNRAVKVTIDIPFKSVHGDAEGLSQALRNLIDNALKFTRQVPEPRIEIGGRKKKNRVVLWVHDNGIGFDMKFHDRIFKIFQRLYTDDVYPGTGIGLSIVRKVMERMDGRAWAESEPGKGATFFLEFPN